MKKNIWILTGFFLVCLALFLLYPATERIFFTGRQVENFSAEKKDATTIDLSWEQAAGAEGYEIFRYRRGDKKKVLCKEIRSGRVLSCTDHVDANHVQDYVIRPFRTSKDGSRVYGKTSRIRAGGLNGSETIGHRGAMDLAPDDTIASFEKARERGYGCFECDLWYTRSGDLFIFHDPTLSILTGKDGTPTKLTENNYLMYPILYGTNSDSYPVQYPPDLDEVLSWASTHDMNLIIHIKSMDVSYDALAFDKIYRSLKKYHMLDRAALFTSSINICRKMAGYPFRRGFLMSYTTRGQRRFGVNVAQKYGCEFLIIKYTDQMPVNIDITAYAHERGIKIGCYNIDRTDQLQHAIRARLDFWITNRALLKKKKGGS